jgi:hypothetical protein
VLVLLIGCQYLKLYIDWAGTSSHSSFANREIKAFGLRVSELWKKTVNIYRSVNILIVTLLRK